MASLSDVKIVTGKRENVESAIQSGKIDQYDMLWMDNDEMGWIDKNNVPHFSTSRTKEEITVNGVTGTGLADGATIPAGASLDDVVKMLVQKKVPATYKKGTATLAVNTGTTVGNKEVGSSVAINLKVNWTQNDCGAVTAVQFKKNGANIGEPVTTAPYEYTEALTIPSSNVVYTAEVSYADGAVKKDNFGEESRDNWATVKAGSIVTNGLTFVACYNIYYGAQASAIELTSEGIKALTGKELGKKSGTFNIAIAAGSQHVAFAYPATCKDASQIMYVETNDTGMLSSFTKSLVDVTDAAGNNVSYKVYTYSMATPAAAGMTFKVTF